MRIAVAVTVDGEVGQPGVYPVVGQMTLQQTIATAKGASDTANLRNVIGEMTGVPTGLGAMIMEARQLSRTEIVICGMVTIGVAGFISDRLVMLLGRRLLSWSPNHA